MKRQRFKELACNALHSVQNSRIIFKIQGPFQDPPIFLLEIQGLFKDFKDRHEIQGFQRFFHGCGNPDIPMYGPKAAPFLIDSTYKLPTLAGLLNPSQGKSLAINSGLMV